MYLNNPKKATKCTDNIQFYYPNPITVVRNGNVLVWVLHSIGREKTIILLNRHEKQCALHVISISVSNVLNAMYCTNRCDRVEWLNLFSEEKIVSPHFKKSFLWIATV